MLCVNNFEMDKTKDSKELLYIPDRTNRTKETSISSDENTSHSLHKNDVDSTWLALMYAFRGHDLLKIIRKISNSFVYQFYQMFQKCTVSHVDFEFCLHACPPRQHNRKNVLLHGELVTAQMS